MKTCIKCSAELDNDAAFCTSCGEPQNSATDTEEADANFTFENSERNAKQKKNSKKGYFYRVIHYAQLEKKEKSKCIKQTIIGGLICIATIVSIPVISTLNKPVDMDADSFVSNWNSYAQQTNNITNGKQIKCNLGKNEYDLGNGCSLQYYISKQGIKKEISDIEYSNPKLSETDIKASIKAFSDMIEESGEKDESSIDEIIESLIPSGVKGIKCLSDGYIQMDYEYDYSFVQSDVTGVAFDKSFPDLVKNINEKLNDALSSKNKYIIKPTDEDCLNCAKSILYDNLKSPSTASIAYSEVADKDLYGRFVVLMTVDAENSFGAMIRQNFCIVIQGVKSDDTFDYNRANVITTFDSSTEETVISMMKQVNGFGKSRNSYTDIEQSDFVKTDYGDFIEYSYDNDSYLEDKESNQIFAANVKINNVSDYSKKGAELVTLYLNSAISISDSEVTRNIKECFDFSNAKVVKDYHFEKGVLYFVNMDGSKVTFGAVCMSTENFKKIESKLNDDMSILSITRQIQENQ